MNTTLEHPPRRAGGRTGPGAERRWRAMGTDAHAVVVVDGHRAAADDSRTGHSRTDRSRTDRGQADRDQAERLAGRAMDRIGELEQLWSRFIPGSEISTLNRVGQAVVSPETFALIDRAVLAWQQTSGRFDPTLLTTLQHLGYDRTFDHLALPHDRPIPPNRVNGCAGIVLDPFTRTVILPHSVTAPDHRSGRRSRSVTFDPGGIGKGYASDLVVEELMAAGATGVMINLGGDLRAEGTAPDGPGWIIDVTEPSWSPQPLAVVELQRGAVATSTPLRRRWRRAGGSDDAHHLLDPTTGRPAVGGPIVVTAIAGEAWWAEAVATAVATTPSGDCRNPPPLSGVAVATVESDGRIRILDEEKPWNR